MGIFSWLFSKNTESNSQVRRWVVTEMERVNSTNPDAYALFIRLIHANIQWGKEPTQQYVQIAKQYLGDATLFEISCYTYYQLEIWLTKHHPEFKNELAVPIRKWIIEKFYTSLYVDQEFVSRLFKEQMDRYVALAIAEKDLAAFHLELEERIILTKGDTFAKRDRQLPKDQSLDRQYIKASIAAYEDLYLPAFIGSIEEYCKQNPKENIVSKQNSEELHGEKDYLFGMALVAQQDWVRACAAFTKVLSAHPKHYDALVQRGTLYLTLQQPTEALQDFSKAIGVEPKNALAYLHRARCQHRKFRRKEKALADYNMAIELAPKNAASYFGRGELYNEIVLQEEKQALETKDTKQYSQLSEAFWAAIHDYSETITLDEKNDTAYLNRALLYARKARVTENLDFITKSIADFQQAISLNWENGYLHKQKDEMEELLARLQGSAAERDHSA